MGWKEPRAPGKMGTRAHQFGASSGSSASGFGGGNAHKQGGVLGTLDMQSLPLLAWTGEGRGISFLKLPEGCGKGPALSSSKEHPLGRSGVSGLFSQSSMPRTQWVGGREWDLERDYE